MSKWIPWLCLTILPVAAADGAPPIEAFGMIPELEAVALSENGRLLALGESANGRQEVVVLDLEAGTSAARFGIDSATKLRDVRFATDATLLITVSVTHTLHGNRRYTYEWFRTLAADLGTGRTQMLLMTNDRRSSLGAALLAARTAEPGTVTMSSWDFLGARNSSSAETRLSGGRRDPAWVHSVFAVSTATGHGRVLAHGSPFTAQWAVDAEGLPIARGDWEPVSGEYTVLASDGKVWRTLHAQRDAGPLALVGPSADRTAVLALGASGGAFVKLWSIPLDGSGARVLIEDPARDVVGVYSDPLTRAPLAVYLGGLASDLRWLDAAGEKRHAALARAFPGRDTRIVGRSLDGERVLTRVEGASHPAVYYLVDFAANRADVVGESYPALANVPLGEVRPLSYVARDGTSIPAYVTLPAGTPEKNLPLVVLPHGGPEARDYPTFDWWAQFLASRGYAVLQPQFRGSIGFGEAHRQAGQREWGGVMQDDITDGVAALVEDGLVDPRRVCIVGASYGGYAALAGAAFTPDLYACAASIGGVADLPGLIAFEESASGEESSSAEYWRDRIGSTGLAEKSPVRAAASIRVPVLLMHGVDDTVVPISQSENMARALRAAGRAVTFVELPGEDHWLSRSETRLRMLAELESFLGKYLTASAATAAVDAASR